MGVTEMNENFTGTIPIRKIECCVPGNSFEEQTEVLSA